MVMSTYLGSADAPLRHSVKLGDDATHLASLRYDYERAML